MLSKRKTTIRRAMPRARPGRGSRRRAGALALAASAPLLVAGLAAGAGVAAAAGGGAGTSGPVPPNQKLAPQRTVGKGEGKLSLVAWPGYAQPQWVKPFEEQTRCTVSATYAGSSSEMVSLMANGGGGRFDLVSAAGDAGLRLIYAGDVKPVDVGLVPSWKQLRRFLQSPAFNTVNGVHYGVSLQFGPNDLLYSTKVFRSAPTSWSVIYSKKYAGEITVPNNPMQIADAALYLSVHDKILHITDPYELTKRQFNAAVALARSERPLVKKYWTLASDEITLFENGQAVVGAAWPYQTGQLLAAHAPVADTIPSEGVTAWADTWMLAAKAPHPNCAYKWLAYVSTPQVQAEQAVSYGETPANALTCALMDKLQKGACHSLHADEPDAYFKTIKFWQTPRAQCGNGKRDCVPFQQWATAWTEITR